MKPPAFEYYAPTTLAEALGMLHELVCEQKRDVKLLAGGQSLIPLLNMRLAHPDVVIDLNPLESQLGYMRRDDNVLRIGALTRYYRLQTNPEIAQYCPMMIAAVRLIGHVAILSRGTIGGSLVHADPSAELPLVFATLGGTVTLQNAAGQRILSAAEFFLSYLTTNIEPDEMLTEIAIPLMPSHSGQAIEEFSMRHGDFALVVAAAQVTLGTDAALQSVRLGLGGVGSTPIDCSSLLVPLTGTTPTSNDLHKVLSGIADKLDPPGDMHASTAYRKELAHVVAYRAVNAALQSARSTSAQT